ncbi:hypothetical protein N7540_004848 [Penicillium herquei]|nr:hypothetical protein N7540_004848 [Penicillium herquei]
MTRNGPAREFSDLTLVCEGHEFKVHKVLICSQIETIHAACTEIFQEAQTGVYEFEEESHIVVSKVVSFLYTQSYDESQGKEGDDNAIPEFSDLQLHARVFAFADRYHIPRLMSFSAEKYKAGLDFLATKPPTLWRRQKLHEENKPKRLRRTCEISSSVIEFLESVPDVFNLTPEATVQLGQICLQFACQRVPYYSMTESFREPYENTLSEAPQFAKGLLDQFFTRSRDCDRDSEFLQFPHYDEDGNIISA